MPNRERRFSAAGTEYTLRFTHEALCRLEKAVGRSIPEIDGNLSTFELATISRAGLEGARLKSRFRAEPYSIEEAAGIINQLGGPTSTVPILVDALRLALPSGNSHEPRESEITTTGGPPNWDQLLSDGMELGLKPDEFWNMTPREFAMFAAAQARRVQCEIQRGLALAWNIAALTRAIPLPPLSQILEPSKPGELSDDNLAERRREFAELTATMLTNGRTNG